MSKVKEAYDQRQIKMHIKIAESVNYILEHVKKVLMSNGVKRKKGHTPRVGLDHELQEFLSEAFEVSSDVRRFTLSHSFLSCVLPVLCICRSAGVQHARHILL